MRAQSALTVSNSLVTGESTTAKQREGEFSQMAEIALELLQHISGGTNAT